MQELILFLVAVLPIVLLGCFIYRKDINKEPKQLLFKLFIGGIGSTILVLVISLILYIICPFLIDMDYNDLNLLQLLLYVFFSIALIEEGCKWLMVYKLSYNNRHFDELYDMIVYATFVSLGFACLENLLYVYNNGIGVGIGRSFLSIPGHVCFGVFMGYYLSLAKLNQILGKINLSKKYLILSVFMPTLLHTIYDYCLLTGNLLWFFVK